MDKKINLSKSKFRIFFAELRLLNPFFFQHPLRMPLYEGLREKFGFPPNIAYL
jgi:hypothetical protein